MTAFFTIYYVTSQNYADLNIIRLVNFSNASWHDIDRLLKNFI